MHRQTAFTEKAHVKSHRYTLTQSIKPIELQKTLLQKFLHQASVRSKDLMQKIPKIKQQQHGRHLAFHYQ